ncbi:hypothetical protein VU03_02145 [Desulfobulbus sp. N3]|nr:hypothetical protein [Desulfobulbus sp. N3]
MGALEKFKKKKKEKTINLVEGALSLLLLLMVLNVSFDVIMRYFFHNSSVAMQEMEGQCPFYKIDSFFNKLF